ncbi:hypothetical protein ACLKA6_019399 [Drosophila palustris]
MDNSVDNSTNDLIKDNLQTLTIGCISDPTNDIELNNKLLNEKNLSNMMIGIPGEPHELNANAAEFIKSENSSLINPKDMNGTQRIKHLRFHTVAHIVVLLQKRLAHSKNMSEYVDVTNDVNYWRALALTRGEQIESFMNVIDLQKKRIDCLEQDLSTLVRLAQETQKMLSDISPENPTAEDQM